MKSLLQKRHRYSLYLYFQFFHFTNLLSSVRILYGCGHGESISRSSLQNAHQIVKVPNVVLRHDPYGQDLESILIRYGNDRYCDTIAGACCDTIRNDNFFRFDCYCLQLTSILRPRDTSSAPILHHTGNTYFFYIILQCTCWSPSILPVSTDSFSYFLFFT